MPDIIVNLVLVITIVLSIFAMWFSIYFYLRKDRKTAFSLLKVLGFLFIIAFSTKFFAIFLKTITSDALLKTLFLTIFVIALLEIMLFFLRKDADE